MEHILKSSIKTISHVILLGIAFALSFFYGSSGMHALRGIARGETVSDDGHTGMLGTPYVFADAPGSTAGSAGSTGDSGSAGSGGDGGSTDGSDGCDGSDGGGGGGEGSGDSCSDGAGAK